MLAIIVAKRICGGNISFGPGGKWNKYFTLFGVFTAKIDSERNAPFRPLRREARKYIIIKLFIDGNALGVLTMIKLNQLEAVCSRRELFTAAHLSVMDDN